jgi:hypothetical protein
LTRHARGVAVRIVLIGILLSYPVWYSPLERHFDSHVARRALAIEAERTARASGERVKSPTGETRRAVVYTPGDPTGEVAANRFFIWVCRLVALTLVLQLFVVGRRSTEEYEADLVDENR